MARRLPQKTHDRSRKDQQPKQSSIVTLSGDHRKRLTTEAARIRSKSNRQLLLYRSPQKTHDRSRKDSQQKQSSIDSQAITAKDSRQKPQGFAAKAIVIVSQAITAKDSRQKPQGFAAKAIVNC